MEASIRPKRLLGVFACLKIYRKFKIKLRRKYAVLFSRKCIFFPDIEIISKNYPTPSLEYYILIEKYYLLFFKKSIFNDIFTSPQPLVN